MDLIESGRYFRCRYCGSFHFPEPVDGEGIRITGMIGSATPCPVCKVAMQQAVLDEQFPVAFCLTCRGVLTPRTTFATVINKRRRVGDWAAGGAGAARSARTRARARLSSLRQAADDDPYAGPGNVVIDSCAACGVIWLDFGEMRQTWTRPVATEAAGSWCRSTTIMCAADQWRRRSRSQTVIRFARCSISSLRREREDGRQLDRARPGL